MPEELTTEQIWLKALGEELDARQPIVRQLTQYHAGFPAVPEHIDLITEETEYRVLIRQAVTNWPELITDSVEERLEVTGFRFKDKATRDKAWDLWQRNRMDSDSGLVHESTLVTGRAYVLVWAGPDGKAIMVPEDQSTTIVAYDVTTGARVAALRRWFELDRWHATLYFTDRICKYQAIATGDSTPTGGAEAWEKREVDGEDWPLLNPLKQVPVVEFAVNRTLGGYRSDGSIIGHPNPQSRMFGSGAGEYERVLPVIDRINTTTFSCLLATLYASFPVRALIGEPISYVEEEVDDGEGGTKTVKKAVPPFRIAVNRLVQLENPEARMAQLPESNLENYIKAAEAHIRHLAAITKTPPHYLTGHMINVSADAIRAAEAGLISKIYKHQRSLGESWEEVIRLGLAVEGAAELPSDERAETRWKNPESRSMAERADAASKLKDLLPAEGIWEYVLQATPQQIESWSANGGGPSLEVVTTPGGPRVTPVPEPEPEPTE